MVVVVGRWWEGGHGALQRLGYKRFKKSELFVKSIIMELNCWNVVEWHGSETIL